MTTPFRPCELSMLAVIKANLETSGRPFVIVHMSRGPAIWVKPVPKLDWCRKDFKSVNKYNHGHAMGTYEHAHER